MQSERRNRLCRWADGWSTASAAGSLTAILILWLCGYFKWSSEWLWFLCFAAMCEGFLTLPCAWVTKLMAKASLLDVPFLFFATGVTGWLAFFFLWFIAYSSTTIDSFCSFLPEFK